ncbi:hypothetical protein BofuT4_uP068200.1 [Botrytis cinerea T4]|uniref:Uncharacterized protein n=1 Tax=Botryotinia fuckeliana (strain T4) TaxID=999810 RepID=G2XQY7_BOTF4|nr:hypothetical protein BofuT4_uP068200.1 [Botrytis cinerea T4]
MSKRLNVKALIIALTKRKTFASRRNKVGFCREVCI